MLSADAKRRFAGNPKRFARELTRAQRERFVQARRAEKRYASNLRQVAQQIGVIVRGFAPAGVVESPSALTEALRRYAQLLEPWARAIATRMIGDVAKRDEQAWAERGAELGRLLRKEIEQAPTGEAMREQLANQVTLITSLPIEAATRVHGLTIEAMTATSARAATIAQEILESGDVSASRARLIARTEVARTATELTKARAQHLGSEGYVWTTSHDPDVRPDHKRLNGKFIAWDDPPIADERTGTRAHAGSIWNCRCWADPVLPDRV